MLSSAVRLGGTYMSPKKSETFEERWDSLHTNLKYVTDKKLFAKKQAFLIRVRRAVSWLERTKQMQEEDVEGTNKDLDTQFVFLWIGFNALYARDPREHIEDGPEQQRRVFEKYFRNLLKFNKETRGRVYGVLENSIAREVSRLLKNKFVAANFWNYYHKNPLKREENPPGWDESQKKKMNRFKSAKETQDILKMLSIVFDHLYTLRNQLMHGGSTWNGGLNYGQLRDGTRIMYWLLPTFIDLMLESPDADWGEVFYPRVGKKPILPFGTD